MSTTGMSHLWSICGLAMRYCSKVSLLLSSINKTLRILLLVLFIFLAVIVIILGPVLENFQPSPILFSKPSRNTPNAFRPLSLTDQDCKKYDFKQLRRPNPSDIIPPIYDLFLFNDELDLLEIRLYELYNFVTLFLVIESRTTLSGVSKPLYLKDNWQMFEKYHDKMRRFEVDLGEHPLERWANEIKIRTEGLNVALKNQTKDILLLTSDVDEIPAAHFMHALSACQLPNPFPSLVLVCAYYYYSFEFRRQNGGTTEGATVSLLKANRTTFPSGKGLRDERFNYQRMPSACYHCSWCFDRINLTRSKMVSFSHIELNRVKFRKQEHILARYRDGKDLFDRPEEVFVRVENNDEIPELIKAQRERFAYMFNRSALVDVGFRDVRHANHSQNQKKMPED